MFLVEGKKVEIKSKLIFQFDGMSLNLLDYIFYDIVINNTMVSSLMTKIA